MGTINIEKKEGKIGRNLRKIYEVKKAAKVWNVKGHRGKKINISEREGEKKIVKTI